jgi:hypothetical protein
MSDSTDKCFTELKDKTKYYMGTTREDGMRIYSKGECDIMKGTHSSNGECLQAFDDKVSASYYCREANIVSGCSINGKFLGKPGTSFSSNKRIYTQEECSSMNGTYFSSGELAGYCVNADDGKGRDGKQNASDVCGKINPIETTISNIPTNLSADIKVKL